MDDFAEAVNALETGVDRAVWQAKEYGMTNKEVAAELRKIADAWEAEGD